MPEVLPEVLNVEITDLSRSGAGVARDAGGRVIFVPFTAPGDRVRVRITGTQKRYAQAEVVEFEERSALRQEPPCAVFGKCGGCKWQHIPYEHQWKIKLAGLQHALKRVGVPYGGPWEEMPAKRIWEYRNRVQLRGMGGELGFYAPGSHELVPIERCEIAHPLINQALGEVRKEGSRLPKPYKVELEVLENGQLRKTWNARHAAGGFRQVHDEQNEKLQEWVCATVRASGARRVLDLYGGSGNFARKLVQPGNDVELVHCVDTSAPSGRPEPKVGGGGGELIFHRSAVLPWILRSVEGLRINGPWFAVVDPPREGLGVDGIEIISALEHAGAQNVAAVGCDADAWAHDLLLWTKRGWKLRAAGAVDLFPQTPHLEAVAWLSRQNSDVNTDSYS